MCFGCGSARVPFAVFSRDTATSLNNLALLYGKTGEYAKAELGGSKTLKMICSTERRH